MSRIRPTDNLVRAKSNYSSEQGALITNYRYSPPWCIAPRQNGAYLVLEAEKLPGRALLSGSLEARLHSTQFEDGNRRGRNWAG